MAQMTMIQVVRQLQAQGHLVDFYVRKDGGILIKQIDGERFPSGASGNARARQIVGTTLSDRKLRQLKQATSTKKSLRVAPEDLKAEWRRVRSKWRTAFPRKGGKSHPAGIFSWARIKYAYQHYGREEAFRRIQEAERYASGLAYSKNVQILSNFIKMAGSQYQSEELNKLADDLETFAYTIKEEWIQPAYDELYKLNSGIPPKEVARNTRAILRL